MAFDGDYHGAVPLLAPIAHHPDAAPLTRLCAQPLAGAYSFALAHGQVGAVVYQGHPSASSRVGVSGSVQRIDDLVVTESLIEVANLEGYLPAWAERVYARVLFASAGDGDLLWSCRVSTSADTGSIYTGRAPRTQDNPFATASLRFVELEASAQVDLQSTTLGQDAVITVELAASTDEEDVADRNPATVKLLGVYVWWANRNG